MRRVLIIAYRFPPAGGIGSIRAASFATHLPELGWEPTVIAPEGKPQVADPDLSFPERRVVRSRAIKLGLPGRAGTGAQGQRDPSGGGGRAPFVRNAMRAAAWRIAYYPDAGIGWYPDAVLAGGRLLRRERFDLVYSSSGPITSHLVARTLSRRAGLPWVAEFRDPWADRVPRIPHGRRARRLEQTIARTATRVVMPSGAWAEHFGRRWNVQVDLIPNGSDRAPVSRADLPEMPVLAHVGSYYPGDQRLLTVWRALAELKSSGSPLPPIRWVGVLSSAARAELVQCGLEDAVEATGFVSHMEATRLLGSSSLLFAGGPVDQGPLGRGWLPAKLFEYLASGLPILYVGDREGDAARLLASQPGCHVVAHGDVEGAKHALGALGTNTVHQRDFHSFSRRGRTCALAEVLESAIQNA